MTQAEIVVALIVNAEGRFLFQKRHALNPVMPNLWELPGGKKESDETSLEGLKREVLEELGISGLDWKPVLPSFKPQQGEGRFLGLYRTRFEGTLITSLSWGWFTAPEALRLQLPDLTRELVSDLLPGT